MGYSLNPRFGDRICNPSHLSGRMTYRQQVAGIKQCLALQPVTVVLSTSNFCQEGQCCNCMRGSCTNIPAWEDPKTNPLETG